MDEAPYLVDSKLRIVGSIDVHDTLSIETILSTTKNLLHEGLGAPALLGQVLLH